MATPEQTTLAPREQLARAIGSLWWLPLLRGILLILLGGYALFRPGMTMQVLTQVIGIYVILEGLLAILAAIVGATPSRGWTAVRGALAIVVGGFVFGHAAVVAGVTATVVLYVIAMAAILFGVLEMVAAIQDRKEIEGGGWMILGGVLTVLFGVILLAAPLAFGLLVVRVLGIFAIASGIALVAFAFRVRSLGKN